jgi:hypothetical protein
MLKYFKEETSKTQVYIRNLKLYSRSYNKYSASFKVYSELSEFFNFRYNISFIDSPLGGFGDISLSDDIFLGAKPLGKYHHFGK